MAQSQTVTNTGIAELILLWREEASTGMQSMVCLTHASPASISSTCTAAVASTFAAPASSCTHCSGNGLSITDSGVTIGGATTNTSGDTITFDKVFTATGSEDVLGIHVCNNDNDVTFVECCFNAKIAMESSDTLTIDGQCTIDQA